MSPRKNDPEAVAWRYLLLLQDLQVNHDLRFAIVRYLYANGEASAITMTKAAAVESDSVSLVSYHVRTLREADVVVTVREVKRRGAIEYVVALAPWAREAIDFLMSAAAANGAKPKGRR